MFTTDGQFLSCFGKTTSGRGEGEFDRVRGILIIGYMSVIVEMIDLSFCSK